MKVLRMPAPAIRTPRDAVPWFDKDLSYERFSVLLLDDDMSVIGKMNVTEGGISSAVINSRDLWREILCSKAKAVIFAHNHPSGSLTPSRPDIETTEKLREAGKLLGIQVLDHIIITKKDYFSFEEHGL